MKNLLPLFLLVFCTSSLFAQTTISFSNNTSAKKIFLVDGRYITVSDSTHRPITNIVVASPPIGDSSINMPVAKPNPSMVYNTPVYKLSGRGSVNMPGTAALDRAEEAALDSTQSSAPPVTFKIVPKSQTDRP